MQLFSSVRDYMTSPNKQNGLQLQTRMEGVFTGGDGSHLRKLTVLFWEISTSTDVEPILSVFVWNIG
jgi:hypothetical protein